MDWVLLFGCAVLVGSAAVVAWAPAAALAFATIAVVLRFRAWPSLFVVLGFALGAARAHEAIDRFERARWAAMPAQSGVVRLEVRGVVASSPVVLHGVARFDVDVADPPLRATLYGGPREAARGDEVAGVVQIGPPDRFDDPEIGDPRVRETRRGVLRTGSAVDLAIVRRARGPRAWIDHARERVRQRIEATFPETTAPLARALVLGETDLATEDDDAFRASGLSHLLAVSGMHLVLVVLGAVAVARAALVRVTPLSERIDVGRLAAALAIPFCWAYSDFAGGSGSAVRASWMLTAALAARVLCRRTTAARTLGLSLLGALAFDPLALFDVSFMLSACATAGLVAFSRPLGDALVARLPRLGAPLKQLAVTIAATLPCAPVLATFAPQIPLGSAAANLLAVPLGETAALPLCLLHALLAPFPSAERGCAVAASGALVAVRAIARTFANLHALQLPVPSPSAWQLAAITFGFAAIVWTRRARSVLAFVAIAAAILLEVPARARGAPHGELRATFVDVGQGDSALVDLPDGSAMLIDGGGVVGSPLDVGRRVVAPLLRARRRDRLALVVLTHPHPDHFGGLDAGLSGVRVDELWDTGQGEREGVSGAYASVLARARLQNTRIVRPPDVCGAHVVGGARVDVLAPCPSASPDRPPNDNSFVLRIAYGRRALVFSGDAEREEEGELVRRYGAALHADVLKVGHHGSKTSSTPAFIAAVSPQIAVVSCGIRNRYGHPFPATLATLAAAGARVHRTDRTGAVVVTTDGESLAVDDATEGP